MSQEETPLSEKFLVENGFSLTAGLQFERIIESEFVEDVTINSNTDVVTMSGVNGYIEFIVNTEEQMIKLIEFLDTL